MKKRARQYLTTFAIIGLEGVGIILAAIAFARNRDKVQAQNVGPANLGFFYGIFRIRL